MEVKTSDVRQKYRILLTGGGTGGHIYPLIAVAVEAQMQAAERFMPLEVRYVGVCGDYRKVLEANEIRVTEVVSAKWRRYFSFANVIDGPKLAFAFLQAVWHLLWYMPDVVFSKGGPGALPVVLAARWYRIPVVVHESDSVPGVTNSICAKYARTIAISFPAAAPYFDPAKTVLVGNPIRTYELRLDPSETQAHLKRFLGFDDTLPLILVLGGSQGAMRLNTFVLDVLPRILPMAQVMHQTGKKNYDPVLGEYAFIYDSLPAEVRKRYRAIDYFEKDIRYALGAADIVLSRAGAGGIFEIAAFGKPSILVPLPEAAGDHQTKNAYDYAATGAAFVIEDANLLPNMFVHHIEELLRDPDRLGKMSEAARNFAKPQAASNLARIVLQLGRHE